MKVYLIPGLGFDNRMFENLELENVDFEYLNWIDPLEIESIKNYAIRLSERIEHDSGSEVILIGHSLGGIIAQEIAAIRPIRKVILLSSIKSRKELPLHFKVMSPLRIYKLFTKQLTRNTIKYWGRSHDYESQEEQALVIDMVNKQSNHYLQWALNQLSIWKKPVSNLDTQIIHIHGDLDKTFPVKLIGQPYKVIPKGGHFLVYKQAYLISTILMAELMNTHSMP